MKLSDLFDRKVMFFRAHIEPGLLSLPKNAIHYTDKDILEMSICEAGVYVKTKMGEHIVPYSNCQTIKLLPEPVKLSKAKEDSKSL